MKRLIGRKYADADVQEELKNVYFRHCELPNGRVGIVVDNNGEDLVSGNVVILLECYYFVCLLTDDCRRQQWRRPGERSWNCFLLLTVGTFCFFRHISATALLHWSHV